MRKKIPDECQVFFLKNICADPHPAVFYCLDIAQAVQIITLAFNLIMTNPRPLGERELALINLYANCFPELSPQHFYAKWAVSYEQIGYICWRDPTTVRRWFAKGRSYRAPNTCDLHHLALMDFLLERYEEIPTFLLDLLCPARQENSDRENQTI